MPAGTAGAQGCPVAHVSRMGWSGHRAPPRGPARCHPSAPGVSAALRPAPNTCTSSCSQNTRAGLVTLSLPRALRAAATLASWGPTGSLQPRGARDAPLVHQFPEWPLNAPSGPHALRQGPRYGEAGPRGGTSELVLAVLLASPRGARAPGAESSVVPPERPPGIQDRTDHRRGARPTAAPQNVPGTGFPQSLRPASTRQPVTALSAQNPGPPETHPNVPTSF